MQSRIAPALLGHLERGLKSPTVKTLEKIAAALDISLAELFSEPQPVSDEKEALLSELRDLAQGLSVESLRKIIAILQNILSLERQAFVFEHGTFSDTYYINRSHRNASSCGYFSV